MLFRLRNWQDRASWTEFYGMYYGFVFSFARRSGLSHADSEEVAQDVFRHTAESIHAFESDPRRGRFRNWIMTQARWRISDKYRSRHPHEKLRPLFPGEGEPAADAIDRLADCSDSGASWEREWRRQVMEAALRRVARRVPARSFQVFDLYSRQNWPAAHVARELGVSPASVYLIHHRLTKLLRAEVARLGKQLR